LPWFFYIAGAGSFPRHYVATYHPLPRDVRDICVYVPLRDVLSQKRKKPIRD